MPWPTQVTTQLGRDPRVGDWWCECCLDDLCVIANDEELDYLLEFNEEFYSGQRYWATEAEARAALVGDSCAADGGSVVLRQDGVVIHRWWPGERICELTFPPINAPGPWHPRAKALITHFELVRVADEQVLWSGDIYSEIGSWRTGSGVDLHREIFV